MWKSLLVAQSSHMLAAGFCHSIIHPEYMTFFAVLMAINLKGRLFNSALVYASGDL